MICNRCGKNNENSRFCIGCGNDLYSANQAPNQAVNQYNSQTQVLNQPVNQYNNQTQIPNQQFVNPYTQNQIPKKKKKGKGCLIAVLIFFIVIGLLIGLLFFLTSRGKKEDKIVINKDYEYLAVTDKGKHIIKDAAKDVKFYVSPDATYVLKDKKGKIVDTVFEDYAIKGKTEYKEGETYYLTLKNGSFVSSQLEGAKEVEFTITKPEKKHYKFNDNVKKVDSKKVSIDYNKNIMTSSEKFVKGDVVTLMDKDNIAEAYIVTNVVNDKYAIRKAKLSEIYSELDFYYKEKVDLSDYKIQKEIENYVVTSMKNSPWYLYIVENVEAAPKITITPKKTDDGIKLDIKLEIKGGEDNRFLKSKNHNLTIKFTYQLSMEQLADITLTNWDVSFNITNSFTVDFIYKNKFFGYEDKDLEKQTKKWVKEFIEASKDEELKDKTEKEEEILTIAIPTPVPGLTVDLELGLFTSVEAFVSLEAKTTFVNNLVVGFDFGLNEDFKPISSMTNNFKDSQVEFKGQVTAKFGITAGIKADLINTVKAGIDAKAGLYERATLVVAAKDKDEKVFNASFSVEEGLFVNVGLSVEVDVVVKEFKKTFSLLNKEVPFVSGKLEYKKILEFNDDGEIEEVKEEEKKSINPKDYLTEKNSCVKVDDNSIQTQTFIYKDGKLKGMTYKYKIYIGNEDTWIETLERIIYRFVAGYYMIQNRSIVYYEDVGEYAVITFNLNKTNALKELGLNQDNDASYSYIKSYQTSKGYTCN